MKRCVLRGLPGGVLLCLLAVPATADITLSLVPPSQTVGVGDVLDVDVAISGLGLFSAPSLGAFDLDVSFDESIVTLAGVAFPLPVDDELDVWGLGNPMGDVPGVGTVNIWELSLDLASDLDMFQVDSFVLATLTFDAVGLGTSSLSISVNDLADSSGLLPLSPVVLEDASVSVIPAPGAAVLAVIGLGLVGWIKRRLA